MRVATIDILGRPAALLRGRRLEYFTIAWNTLEGLVALVTGIIAGSISLVGFGIDSFIEVTSGSVLLWRMSVDSHANRRERNEKWALRIVGACFLLLAAYVVYDSILDLWSKRAPEYSIEGIVLACVSLVVMPWGEPWAAPPCTRTPSKRSFALHLSIRHPTSRIVTQCLVRPLVSRSHRGPRHGSDHCERGNRRIAGQNLQ